MQAETLDILERAEFPSVQARAIARAIDVEVAASRQTLATRADLVAECGRLHGEFERLRGEFVVLKHALEARIEGFKSEILNRMYAALLAQIAVLLALAYVFLNRYS